MKFITNFSCVEDVIENYGAPADALDGATIHLAWYGYGSYEGSSLVIFEKDGKLYEVNGSHCSCNGLEGQWDPEETSWAALGNRDFSGGGYYDGEDEANKEMSRLVREHLN